jgi:DNA primase
METVIPALQDGLQARFLFLPDGEDPDTIVRKEGKEAFEKRLDDSKHLPEFLFDNVKEQVDFDTLDGKARFGQLAAPLISRLPTGMLKELMQQQLSQETGIKQEILAKLLPTETEQPNQHRAYQQPTSPLAQDTVPKQNQQSSAHVNPHSSDDGAHYDGPAFDTNEEHQFDVGDFIDTDTATHFSLNVTSSANSKENKQLTSMTEKALTLLVKFPESAQHISPLEDFEPEDENERLLCETLKKLKRSPQNSSIGLLILWTGSPYADYIKSIANKKLDYSITDDNSHYIQGTLQDLQLRALRREWKLLQKKIATQSFNKLTAEEKTRYIALPRQLKKAQKTTNP